MQVKARPAVGLFHFGGARTVVDSGTSAWEHCHRETDEKGKRSRKSDAVTKRTIRTVCRELSAMSHDPCGKLGWLTGKVDLRDTRHLERCSHLERRACDPYDIGMLVSAGDPRVKLVRGQPTRRRGHETENLQ
jgi:hypothetical protein